MKFMLVLFYLLYELCTFGIISSLWWSHAALSLNLWFFAVYSSLFCLSLCGCQVWSQVLISGYWRLGRMSCWEGILAFLSLSPRSMFWTISLVWAPGGWSLHHWAPLPTTFLLVQLKGNSSWVLRTGEKTAYWSPLPQPFPLSSWFCQ